MCGCPCSKLEEYYCIGCYWKYSLTTETYFTRTLWCWGLGYLWEKNLSDPTVKPTSSYDFEESGASCFTGLITRGTFATLMKSIHLVVSVPGMKD
jgi:hypothetical protein